MLMSGKSAAQIARDAATGLNGDFYELSALMCWDAVVYCMVRGGGSDPGSITSASSSHVVSTGDPAITSGAEMRWAPQGAFIGFFDGSRLIHAMIATGHGFAAGNKNACLGIGNPVGWEILDVAGRLDWLNGGVCVGGKRYGVHYRAMG
jgi:hypothetical protein